RMEDQLHADERENERNAVLEVHEAVDEIAEQEIELPQTHERENVRRENDERALRYAEDRRNRIDREHQIGRAQRDDHNQDRGEGLLAVDLRAPLAAVELLGDADPPAQERDDAVLGLLLVVMTRERLIPGRVQQEGPEDVEDPTQVLD